MPLPSLRPQASRWRTAAVLAATGATAVAATFVVASSTAAVAAPTGCTASDTAIYTAPARITGAAGSILACRSTPLSNLDQSTPFKAWKVQYVSTNVAGQKVATTGTVIVPTAPWLGGGSRPVVAFTPGTLGLGQQCAFSKQLAGQYQDAYEFGNINASLKAGYAVAATDGQGYLINQVHPYIVGVSAGNAVLDGARSAFNVPGAGLSRSTKVGIWGYSEGGAASLWGAQLARSYAPELNVVGVASGGVPGELRSVAAQLNGGPFAGFLVDAVIGLSSSYPNLPFQSLLNQKGIDAVASAKKLCLIGTLASLLGAKIEDYNTQGLSLNEIYQLRGTDGTTWGEIVDRQTLGVSIGKPGSGAKYQIGFPSLQYRGIAEEVIATSAEEATRSAYCKAGITTQWNLYPGEHLTTDPLAVDDVVKWLGDRFAGRSAPSNCPWF